MFAEGSLEGSAEVLKTEEAKKPKKGLLLKIGAIAFGVYFLYSLITTQVGITQKKAELDALRKEYSETLIRNEELQRTLDSYGTDEFIEQQARAKLGYAYSDEHIYIDVSGTE